MLKLDDTDLQLLALLQEEFIGPTELAQRVGLSAAGVHRRLRRLRQEGIVQRPVALLNRHRLGIDLLCILHATFRDNMDPRNREALAQAVHALPEVLECYLLTGASDVLLKVAVRDHQALKCFLERFAKAQNVIARVETAIVLEDVKVTTAFNIENASS